jgi:hypothetical protein
MRLGFSREKRGLLCGWLSAEKRGGKRKKKKKKGKRKNGGEKNLLVTCYT